MKNPAHEIYAFVIEKAATEQPAKRVQLYRALAEVIGSRKFAEELTSVADDIEACEMRQQQLRLALGKIA